MDGRSIAVPIAWYPRLLSATSEQRQNWETASGGYGIHWPDIDEDLSTEGLLRGAPAPRGHIPNAPPRRATRSGPRRKGRWGFRGGIACDGRCDEAASSLVSPGGSRHLLGGPLTPVPHE